MIPTAQHQREDRMMPRRIRLLGERRDVRRDPGCPGTPYLTNYAVRGLSSKYTFRGVTLRMYAERSARPTSRERIST